MKRVAEAGVVSDDLMKRFSGVGAAAGAAAAVKKPQPTSKREDAP